jgi:hypothetical protein
MADHVEEHPLPAERVRIKECHAGRPAVFNEMHFPSPFVVAPDLGKVGQWICSYFFVPHAADHYLYRAALPGPQLRERNKEKMKII